MSETSVRRTHIAYRCPACTDSVFGLIGQYALAADMLRLKCPCGKSAFELHIGKDKKVRLSVPCILCGKNHDFTVAPPLLFTRDLLTLPCPYSGVSIGFAGKRENITEALQSADARLQTIAADYAAESVRDLQPQDLDEDEIVPEPQVYDIVRLLMLDLEADGKIDCPCHAGKYDIRYTKDSVQIFCPRCGATHDFPAASVAAAQDFLNLSMLQLH